MKAAQPDQSRAQSQHLEQRFRLLLLAVPLLIISLFLFFSPRCAAASDASGASLYRSACAACHGLDGRGAPATQVGFEIPLPDFTDCFAFNKEPDADWFTVIHQGGPARAWSTIMPAFGQALTEQQINDVIAYVRNFCTDKRWPRGDLNIPRALFTEKAFPEGEVVSTFSFNATEGAAASMVTVYEKRFGPLSQLEIKTPLLWQRSSTGSWFGGIGDVTLGWKRVLVHSLGSGSIFSAAGEIVLPAGNRARGFGKGTTVLEAFASYGQILPRDSHLQFQLGAELPTDTCKAARAVFWRTTIGKTLTQNGGLGRAWTPMVEFIADRELESGARTSWDVVPQFQVTLSRRQHIMANFGLRIPASNTAGRPVQVVFYLLWDYLDGGLRQGW